MAPQSRLKGHVLFVHAATRIKPPDLPCLVDTGANVLTLPYNLYMVSLEVERPVLTESPLQIFVEYQIEFNVADVMRLNTWIKDEANPCLMHACPDSTSGVFGMDVFVPHHMLVDRQDGNILENHTADLSAPLADLSIEPTDNRAFVSRAFVLTMLARPVVCLNSDGAILFLANAQHVVEVLDRMAFC